MAIHHVDHQLERSTFGRVATDDNRCSISNFEDRIITWSERTDPLGIDVAVEEFIVSVLIDVEHRLGHRDIDSLAETGALTPEQGSKNRSRRLERCVGIGMGPGIVRVRPS